MVKETYIHKKKGLWVKPVSPFYIKEFIYINPNIDKRFDKVELPEF